PFTGGKSLEGSLTCFVAVLSSSYAVTQSVGSSAVIAVTATVLEAAPTKDADNLLLPLGTGLVAMLVML
ncbi:MAG TPA: phosphatidate cytidylyltransferase, partial [Spirochaetales bacterium]|nr:phosphatidate cytidylyltransferase [Spirochaetales bacterium]